MILSIVQGKMPYQLQRHQSRLINQCFDPWSGQNFSELPDREFVQFNDIARSGVLIAKLLGLGDLRIATGEGRKRLATARVARITSLGGTPDRRFLGCEATNLDS